MIFETVSITGRETQVQLPKGWSTLMRIITTGRCCNTLLNCFFFLSSLRNVSFPQCKGTTYLFFRLLNQMKCIHAPWCVLELLLLQSQQGRILLLLLLCFSCGTLTDKAVSCSWGFLNTQGNFYSSSMASFLFWTPEFISLNVSLLFPNNSFLFLFLSPSMWSFFPSSNQWPAERA